MTEPAKRTDNWGRWGDQDERGALNVITPETVLQSMQACRTGRTYDLSLPIQRDGVPVVPYRGAPMRMTLANHTDAEMFSAYGGDGDVGANEDVLILASHNETHMDALCHVFADGQMYNGFPAESMRSNSGAARLGIEKAGPIVGRAVLLDVVEFLGADAMESHAITAADLEGCARAQGVRVRSGDVLLLRTGWIERFLDDPGGIDTGRQPGLGMDAVRFVREHDIAAVGADNSAVEVMPFDGGQFLAVHIELLVKLGVHLLEHLVLTEMAHDRVYESLLVVSPLAVTGATGSPISPVAIG